MNCLLFPNTKVNLTTDYYVWSYYGMDSIPISKFKATCLALLDQVNRTSKPLEITRNGKSIAIIYPSPIGKNKSELFGCMRGHGSIQGDIVSPLPEEAQPWSVLK